VVEVVDDGRVEVVVDVAVDVVVDVVVVVVVVVDLVVVVGVVVVVVVDPPFDPPACIQLSRAAPSEPVGAPVEFSSISGPP
jgi:hypothetical protein